MSKNNQPAKPAFDEFVKPFAGVIAGEIYPTEFAVGDTCPEELLDAAREAEAVPAIEQDA